MKETLVDRIARHEGFSSHVYLDSQDFLSIGYGTTIGRIRGRDGLSAQRVVVFRAEGVGLTKVQARFMLVDRVNAIQLELAKTSERKSLSFSILHASARRDVLIEMAYQLGVRGCLNFKLMWAALAKQDYETAAREMLDSRWARQTVERAHELAEIMRTGMVTT